MSQESEHEHASRSAWTRRQMLKSIGVGVAGTVLAACGAAPAATNEAAVAPTSVANATSEPVSTTTNVAPSAGQTTVRFHARTGTDAEYYEPQVEAFHKTQDRVRIELELTPQAEYVDKLTTLVAGGQLGDAFWSGIFFVFYPFSARDLTVDLRPLAEADGYDLSVFFPGVLEQLTWDGKLTGWPQRTHSGWSIMYTNTDAWEQADAEIPQWEWNYETEWLQALTAVTKLDKPDFAFTFDYGQPAQAAYTFIRSWGGDWIDPNDRAKSLINSEKTVAALMFMHDLVHKHQVTPPPDAVVDAMFENQLVASMTTTISANTSLQSTIKDAFKWQARPMPQGPGGRGSFLGADSLSINTASTDPDAVFEWLKWLTTKEAQLAQIAVGYPAPTIKSAWDDPLLANDPAFQVARQWQEVATGWTYPANARVGEFRTAFTQGFQAFMLEKDNPMAAIEQMHEAVQAALDKPAT